MKRQPALRQLLLTTALGGGCCTFALAGEPMAPAPAPISEPSESVLSGSLTLDYNTHFVSYGNDVWNAGTDFGHDATFNPALSLTWQLTDALSFTAGTWWDVNDNVTSAIGGDLQEVDLFFGLTYDAGLVSVSGTYQAWIYGSDTEHVFDLGVSLDTFLSPTLTIHNRFEEGASGGDTGTVLVLGVSHGFELGPVSFSIPVNVGYFLDDGFHGLGVTDDGFGFASTGLSASIPLPIDDKFGEWDLHGGLTYYVTDEDVTGDDDNAFLTGTIGIGVAF